METNTTERFDRGRAYSRAEITRVLGGSRRDSLPTRGGEVVCACMTLRRNPRAPDEMLFGAGRANLLARSFAASGRAVPVFVAMRAGEWEYAGERRVRRLVEEPGALLALIAEGVPPDTTLALLLEEAAPAAGGAARG